MSLTNAQYESIMRDYSRKQAANATRHEAKLKEIYASSPAIQEINSKISHAAVQHTAATLQGSKTSIKSLKDEIEKLKQEKITLLESLGYSYDDLEMKYDCNDCKDTGFINNKPCHCFKQAAINLVYSQSNLDNILTKENFDTFNFDYYDKSLTNDDGTSSYDCAQYSFKECKKFCEHFSSQINNNLLLCGPVGVGKTFLTHCIAKELLDNSFSVLYFTADELIDLFQKKTFEKSNFEDEEISNLDSIYSVDALIIDDLGTEFVNSFTSAKFFNCINERLLRGKSTIISTNLSLGDISSTYSERTFSRISQYKIIQLFGRDIRVLKRSIGAN